MSVTIPNPINESAVKINEIIYPVDPTKNKTALSGATQEKYLLTYDNETGDHQLIRAQPNSQVVVFDNGAFTVEGTEDTTLINVGFENIQDVIAKDVKTAYDNSGGNSNSSVIPGWVKNKYPDLVSNETGNNTASNNEGKNNVLDNVSNTVKDFYAAAQDTLNEWNIDKNILKKEFSNITENTIKELMRRGPLNYPQDALYSSRQSGFNQDHVRITQYTYRPPRSETFTSGGKENFGAEEFKNIVTEGIQRNTPLEKYLGMVKLPMPTDISDSNNVNWGSDSMNNLSAAMTAGVMNNLAGASVGAAVAPGAIGVIGGMLMEQGLKGELQNISRDGIVNKLKEVYNGAGGVLLNSTLSSKVLSSAGVQVSPEAILARGYGVIPNANMELLFQSPALRSFSFNWKMTPRDEDEARVIRYIIRFFKQGMAARKTSGSAGESSLYLGTPNVFHVQYKTNQDQNMEGLNRIKTCACTGCSINYTPDGVWSAYEEGQPVSTIMALRMQELEPVYDTDYQNKIIEGRVFNENPTYSDDQGDLYPIGINEVGY